MKKRVLAILLAALMFITLLPTAVFANAPTTVHLDNAKGLLAVPCKGITLADSVNRCTAQLLPEDSYLTEAQMSSWAEFYSIMASSFEESLYVGSNGDFTIMDSGLEWVLLFLMDDTVPTAGGSYVLY